MSDTDEALTEHLAAEQASVDLLRAHFPKLLQDCQDRAARYELKELFPTSVNVATDRMVAFHAHALAAPRLVRNAAKCGACGDEIESTTRHDFTSCTCGAVSVDGGRAYSRRVYVAGARWEDLDAHESTEQVHARLAAAEALLPT